MLRFNDKSYYKQFVNDRDEALEKIYRNHRLKITDTMNNMFIDVLTLCSHRYPMIMKNPYNSKSTLRGLEDSISHVIDTTIHHLVHEQILLRKKSYMLAHAGEAQAIATTVNKTAKYNLSRKAVEEYAHQDLIEIQNKFKESFIDLRRKIVTAVELSAHLSDELDVALGRVYRQFPKKKALSDKKALRKVKKITEADKPSMKQEELDVEEQDSGVNITLNDFKTFEFDQETWNQLVEDYKTDYIPVDRSPESFFDLRDPYSDLPITDDIPEADKIYDWQVEKEMTHDFVQSVRDGQVDAANANGIDDFVWIAVIDGKTCEDCCVWRNGLLSSEIEKKLDEEPELKDYCDAIVAPAHFNCRCTIAPASSDLEAVDNSDMEKDFQAWLDGE